LTFANGLAARDVEVRVFDKDAPGKGDDDLTLKPGQTDERGRFTVVYDPGRYQDFARLSFLGLGGKDGLRVPDPLDILLPYLQFCYRVAGEERIHTAPLELFQDEFRLPESPRLAFRPSQHGFRFVNNFPGFQIPFSLPGIPVRKKLTANYGLCGGMSAASSDYFLSGHAVPQVQAPPRVREKLYRYLFQRAMDSFDMGESIRRFARWMTYPDGTVNGTWRLTVVEFEEIKRRLDNHQLVPIGLVFSKGANFQEITQKVWLNHQVLSYGYRENEDGSTDILIYDPNCDTDGARQDGVHLHCEWMVVSEPGEPPVYGLRTVERDLYVGGGKRQMEVRGFFPMPYTPIVPPV
jgi:hypothetical protein